MNLSWDVESLAGKTSLSEQPTLVFHKADPFPILNILVDYFVPLNAS